MERSGLKIEKSLLKFLWDPGFIAYSKFDVAVYHTSHSDKLE